jgi:hypothetical protein
MSDIIEQARALWAAVKAAWDKLRSSGGGGGPGTVK